MIIITNGVVPDLHLEHMGRRPLAIGLVIPVLRLRRVGVGDLRRGVIVARRLLGVVNMLRIVRFESSERRSFPLRDPPEGSCPHRTLWMLSNRGRRTGAHREEVQALVSHAAQPEDAAQPQDEAKIGGAAKRNDGTDPSCRDADDDLARRHVG